MSIRRPPTQVQRDVHAWMLEYQRAQLAPPSYREIQDQFGWTSANAVHELMRAMLKKGMVARFERASRCYVAIPLAGESTDVVQAEIETAE